MGTTLKVRVNPKKPTEFAILADPNDQTHPWYKRDRDIGYGWTRGTSISDWPEYTLDLPEPPREFKPGDVVKTIGTNAIRVRDENGEWTAATGGVGGLYDDRVRERLAPDYTGINNRLEYLGNVTDLVPAF